MSMQKQEKGKRQRKPTGTINTAIAVVSCHIKDTSIGVDPNNKEELHSRDVELEEKLKGLVSAVIKAVKSGEDIEL